jgi:hypothetical protein
MTDTANRADQPVPRDTERFRLLFSNSPAKIPADYSAPLDNRTTLEMMHDRDNQANKGKTPK